jgi:hypothetical protein
MPGAVPVRSPSPEAIALLRGQEALDRIGLLHAARRIVEQRMVDGAGRTGLEDHGGLDACSGVSLLHRVPT